ncbi:MAG: hypothetical protein HRU17_03285 [Polyangiaceae bacterium]|nr:hypothetical protein [Polyangiaceae bacterium]
MAVTQRRARALSILPVAAAVLTAGLGCSDGTSATPPSDASPAPTTAPAEAIIVENGPTGIVTANLAHAGLNAGDVVGGAMVTFVLDDPSPGIEGDPRAPRITVFTNAAGRYRMPTLAAGTYVIRSHLLGFEDQLREAVEVALDSAGTALPGNFDLVLSPTSDLTAQLPANYFYGRVDFALGAFAPTELRALTEAEKAEMSPAGIAAYEEEQTLLQAMTPAELEAEDSRRAATVVKMLGDFTRSCGGCHQIGDEKFRRTRSVEEWQEVLALMKSRVPPFFSDTARYMETAILNAFGPDAAPYEFDIPTAPSGRDTRVVITEWDIDPDFNPSCHDLEIGLDGQVYTVGGMYAVNTVTGERSRYPLEGGGHSIEMDSAGDMWITAPGPDQLIRLDVGTSTTGSPSFTRYDHPTIGIDEPDYPHTLRFDQQGRIWETLTESNHVAMFDPAQTDDANGGFKYYRLPPADPAISGIPIAVAYGLDIAPDQSVWWSQLMGNHIGRIDPESGAITSWQTPFIAPRRLHVGPNNRVWVPFYGASRIGRLDPTTESWDIYELPVDPVGSDFVYALNVHPITGEVWSNGTNSDSLYRLNPETEEWTRYRYPSMQSYTREVEFHPDGSVWTCTSDTERRPGMTPTGRIVRFQPLMDEPVLTPPPTN